MDTKKIKQIIDLFEDSSVAKMELEIEDIKIRLEKENTQLSYTQQPEIVKPVQLKEAIIKTETQQGEALKSPLVGTYYASASEGGTPFVEVGKKVKKGDTLCIIEAMKVMNEIKAEKDGVITAIVVENNQMVQFDDVLMYIE